MKTIYVIIGGIIAIFIIIAISEWAERTDPNSRFLRDEITYEEITNNVISSEVTTVYRAD